MKKTNAANLDAICTIAKALGELNDRVAFVGGPVVSLYINDPAAGEARPTKDVDVSLEITSLGELEKLRTELARKGFQQSPEDNVICRFRFNDINVDVLSTKEVGWAPSNLWFAPGFNHLEARKVEGVTVHMLPLAYFLASKFSAFRDRGAKDPRTSRDLEDIVYVLDNRTDIVEVISGSPGDVREFLNTEFQHIVKSESLREGIMGNLSHETRAERLAIIIGRLENIIQRI